VRLHRVIVLGGSPVGRVDADRGGGERAVEVADCGVSLVARVDVVRLVQSRVALSQRHVVCRLLVGDPDLAGGLPRGLERVCHRRGHELPAVGDRPGLEQGKLRITGPSQPRRVVRGDHGEHARQR